MEKKEMSTKKVLLISILLIALTAILTGVGTFAYFSSSQVTGPHNFFSGSIDILVNGANPWTGSFNASLYDLKPNMTGWGNVTVTNSGLNPADLWINVTNVSATSVGTNPAKQAEPAASDIDGVIRYGLYNWTLAGPQPAVPYVNPNLFTISTGTHQMGIAPLGPTTAVKNSWIYLGTIQPNQLIQVNESFTMDSNTTNWAQLTNMTFTVNFYAQQSQGNPPNPLGQLAGHARL